MKEKIQIIGLIFLILFVGGCGLYQNQIGKTVKLSMQEKFNSDPQFKKFHLVVTDVQIAHKGGNQYQGIAKITYQGTSYDVPVEITADRDRVIWQVPPGGFSFILQAEIETWQNIF